jgi:hypothetical protein
MWTSSGRVQPEFGQGNFKKLVAFCGIPEGLQESSNTCGRHDVCYFNPTVQLIARQYQRPGKAIIASLLTGLVLLLNAMAASPSLHEWFHSDAGESGHHCAVTLFAHGQVDSSTVDVVVVGQQTFVAVSPSVEISVFSPAIENLPAGRAPPVSPSYS